jgi:hypothetical protein
MEGWKDGSFLLLRSIPLWGVSIGFDEDRAEEYAHLDRGNWDWRYGTLSVATFFQPLPQAGGTMQKWTETKKAK